MTQADVEARMKAQMQPDVLLSKADIVVRNDGTMAELEIQADRVWEELVSRRAGSSR